MQGKTYHLYKFIEAINPQIAENEQTISAFKNPISSISQIRTMNEAVNNYSFRQETKDFSTIDDFIDWIEIKAEMTIP